MWQVQGSIVDHEYQMCGPAGKVGAMDKNWFRIAETHCIEVRLGCLDAPVVAAGPVVDSMSRPAR